MNSGLGADVGREHERDEEEMMEPASKKRCKEGHRRPNGRWEARHRPKSSVRLDHTNPEFGQAYRGIDPRSGFHKYEWLQYFDSKAEKDAFIRDKRELFKHAKKKAVASLHHGVVSVQNDSPTSSSSVASAAWKGGNTFHLQTTTTQIVQNQIKTATPSNVDTIYQVVNVLPAPPQDYAQNNFNHHTSTGPPNFYFHHSFAPKAQHMGHLQPPPPIESFQQAFASSNNNNLPYFHRPVPLQPPIISYSFQQEPPKHTYTPPYHLTESSPTTHTPPPQHPMSLTPEPMQLPANIAFTHQPYWPKPPIIPPPPQQANSIPQHFAMPTPPPPPPPKPQAPPPPLPAEEEKPKLGVAHILAQMRQGGPDDPISSCSSSSSPQKQIII